MPSEKAKQLHHGFFDESGDVGFSEKSSQYLVGAVVLTRSPHSLERVAWKVRKDARKKRIRLPELKAKLLPEWLVLEGLQYAMETGFRVIVAVVDKGARISSPDDPEEVFRHLLAHVVKRCVVRYPNFHLVLDNRYNNQRLRDKLGEAIQIEVAKLEQSVVLTLEHLRSEAKRELLVADFVAWSLFQKYERDNNRLYQVIKERIVSEEIGRWKAIMSSRVNEKTAWHPSG